MYGSTLPEVEVAIVVLSLIAFVWAIQRGTTIFTSLAVGRSLATNPSANPAAKDDDPPHEI